MNIGIAGPVDIRLLADLVDQEPESLPHVYSFPLTAHIAREIHDQGHEVAVFALSYNSKKACVFHGPLFSIYVIPARHAYLAILDMFRKEVRLLREAMREADCDIIHAHWHYEFALAALSFPTKALITLHDAPLNVMKYLKAPRYYSLLRRFVMGSYVLEKAEYLTAVSPYLTDYFASHYPKRHDIQVVPNGIVPELIKSVKRTANQTTSTVFANIGAQGEGKNSNTAIAAFKLIQQQMPSLKMLVFGPFSQTYQQKMQDDNLVFLGNLPQNELLTLLTNEVDVLVQTTREESFGMAILEGMALGIPVIAGRASGAVPYLLEDGKCGVLTDINDPKAVANAMFDLAFHPQKRYRLAVNAQRRVKKCFLLPDTIKKYMNIYCEIIENAR